MRPAPPGGSPLMTVDEAAVYLRIVDAEGRPDRPRFYQWKRRAQPTCYRLGKDARCVRFRREDLDAVLVVEERPAPLVLRGFGGRGRAR
jgi:hypothetical protein